ncbi:MAG: endonuclease III [Calditrichaeota bacterium]|nr:endonuclease III [Candidatus Cloacimonadota bacterium]MCB1046945.1 endonuclease III [Calditrichota bacterium]MCB9473576.1 endonuclease III [Candidatus Delongbacteria bacterium]
MKETKTARKARAARIVELLRETYPDSRCSLDYGTPHQLLVATILSAQCTDARVNTVCVDLFRKYRSVKAFAQADEAELAQDIRSCGYFNQKAKSLLGMSRALVEHHGGEVPDTIEELVKLPGVGRKTANCILGEVYGVPSMVIDTHMVRIMNLLGLGDTSDPVKLEQQLMQIFEPAEWVSLVHRTIDHGRAVCIARRPRCGDCVLRAECPSSKEPA